MKLTFINVGYGEAILLRRGGFTALIDGGSGEAEEYAGGRARIRCADCLEALGVDHIDLMINTHIHEDHTCGLVDVVERFPVARFCTGFLPELPARDLSGAAAPDASTDKFIRALNDHRALVERFRGRGAPVSRLLAGDVLEPVPGLRLEAFAPDAAVSRGVEEEIEAIWRDGGPWARIHALDARFNNCSVILRVDCEGCSALLVGDTNKNGYAPFAGHEDRLRADVFKVGHHGQIDGVAEAQMAMISPRYVVFCASSDRRYDSAHPDIIAMAERHGARVLLGDPPVPEEQSWQALEFTFRQGSVTFAPIRLTHP